MSVFDQRKGVKKKLDETSGIDAWDPLELSARTPIDHYSPLVPSPSISFSFPRSNRCSRASSRRMGRAWVVQRAFVALRNAGPDRNWFRLHATSLRAIRRKQMIPIILQNKSKS